MAYTFPADAGERPVAVEGAGTLAGGSQRCMQRAAARCGSSILPPTSAMRRSRSLPSMWTTIEGSSERVLTGALHWFSVGVAVGAVALVAQIPSWLAWPLGSATATTLFLLCSSLQLAFVSSRSSRE
jgi:hypothetical protein